MTGRGSGGWGWGAQEETERSRGRLQRRGGKKKWGKKKDHQALRKSGDENTQRAKLGGISQTGKANTRANDGDTQRKAANLAGARRKAPIPRTPSNVSNRPWTKAHVKSQRKH